MKRILPFVFTIITGVSFGQTNHDLNWGAGINGTAASLTINVGDTVTWIWTDALAHTVSSLAGAAETFSSGVVSGAGSTYFHVFTVPGTNDYQCDIHTTTMFGTITVNAVTSVEEVLVANIKVSPNPVQDELSITSDIPFDRYVVCDVLGNEVENFRTASVSNGSIDFSDKPRGLYFVSVYYGQNKQVLRVIKK